MGGVAHPAAFQKLPDSVASKGGGGRSRCPSLIHEPHVGDEGICDYLLDRIIAGFHRMPAERIPGVPLDRGNHREKSGMPGTTRARRSTSSDHGTISCQWGNRKTAPGREAVESRN